MDTTPAYNARFAAFWTRKKKLLFLFLVLFVTFSYYYMSYGGKAIWWYARISRHGEVCPFSFADFLFTIWVECIDAHFWEGYAIALAPFLLLYLFWWFRPNIRRFIAPGFYLFLLLTVWFAAVRPRGPYSWEEAIIDYPGYISQIPAWLKFLYM